MKLHTIFLIGVSSSVFNHYYTIAIGLNLSQTGRLDFLSTCEVVQLLRRIKASCAIYNYTLGDNQKPIKWKNNNKVMIKIRPSPFHFSLNKDEKICKVIMPSIPVFYIRAYKISCQKCVINPHRLTAVMETQTGHTCAYFFKGPFLILRDQSI